MLSCKKDTLLIVPDNDAPEYGDVSRVLIENYVNRIYIDILGREPLDGELESEYEFLREQDLSEIARRSIVSKLMTDTTFREGEISFRHAYYQRIYDLSKARYLEGASDGELSEEAAQFRSNAIRDSLEGNITGYEKNMAIYNRIAQIPLAKDRLRNNEITLDTLASYMIFNPVYDFINMNTFNFINASFDDLFHRFPSESEFYEAFDMIEYNQSGTIFGKSGSNKDDYVSIVVSTQEFSEGTVIWSYRTLLARDPNTVELFNAFEQFKTTKNIEQLWEDIIITDEYANFD